MKVIHELRGSGKTTKLIEMAVEADAIIVCATPQRMVLVTDLAKRMGVEVEVKYIHQNFRGLHRSVVIDDVDAILSEFVAHNNIIAVAITESY